MTLGDTDTIEQLTVNTIRTLSMDAVQAANSGHPGTPMALAPVAYKLWRDYLRFDPEFPVWRTGIGSCFRSGTRRRCCTRCCIWPG
jgi:transketolase